MLPFSNVFKTKAFNGLIYVEYNEGMIRLYLLGLMCFLNIMTRLVMILLVSLLKLKRKQMILGFCLSYDEYGYSIINYIFTELDDSNILYIILKFPS